MTLDILRIAASEFNILPGETFPIFDLAGSTTTTVSYTLPDGVILYILEVGGNSTNSDVIANLTDQSGQRIMRFEEFPDFFSKYDFYPFLNFPVKKRFDAVFVNQGTTTATITFFMRGILVQQGDDEKFKNILKRHYGIMQGKMGVC